MKLIKRLKEYVVEIVGLIAGILAIEEAFSLTHYNAKVLVCIAVIVLMFIALIIENNNLERKLAFIRLLVRDRHIHTARMITLRDNYSKLTDIDIKKENRFDAISADFIFRVFSSRDGKSSVEYNHKFCLKSKLIVGRRKERFVPWFFGENECPPVDCQYRFGETTNLMMPINAKPVVSGEAQDYAVNEGVFKMVLPESKMTGGDEKYAEIKYTRRDAFSWSRDEMFVIWPECFFQRVDDGGCSITIEFEDEVVKDLVIYISEYKHNKVINNKYQLEKNCNDLGKVVYKKDNLTFSPKSVYIISITSKKV